MFSLSSRRYTGAKTKLLDSIDESILETFDYRDKRNLSFFDVFCGTGMVSEYFMQKPQFSHCIINDFLHSNYAIYQGFFAQDFFDFKKLESLRQEFANLRAKNIKENYCSKSFGEKFFSKNDSKIIGYLRDELDRLLEVEAINKQEFYILLSSLLYSVDRIANTVGHYDAYRKNIALQDKFTFTLIKPLQTNAKIEIYKEDSNLLARNLKSPIDIAFIDPPYNSRQYSRFYHLLENLAQNNKPKLYGIARKPKPENLSKYCKVEAKETFKDLIESLAKICKVLVVSYNNTYVSKSSSNRNKIQSQEVQKGEIMTYREAIEAIMENNGGFAPLNIIYKHIWDYKDKNEISGKTPNATIRETLQRNDTFFPLGIGVWALNKYKHILTAKESVAKTKEEKQERMHAKIQGMLLELGNQRGLDTYTNDKSWIFNNKKLGSLCSLQEIPPFTYTEIIKKSVNYVDVAWFSADKYAFPVRICEVEHSSDFRAALTKFKELEFFNTEFYCIADSKREEKFKTEIHKNAFKSLVNRVKFMSYKDIIETYEYEMKKIKF